MFPLAAIIMLTSHCDASLDRPGIREHHPVCYVTEDKESPFAFNNNRSSAPPETPVVLPAKPKPDPKP